MNLPILGTLSTLFNDATGEFRKLFAPWSLVPAAVLMGLALVFFYPPLPEDAKLGAGTLILLTTILFALAYLINTLGAAFLALASGRPLRDSPLVSRALLWKQRRHFDRLATDINNSNPTDEIQKRAFYRLAYEFPARDDLALTRLGNIRAAVATYSLKQYGAHLDTVWPLVQATLAKDDEKLLGQTHAEQTATTFLATLGILLLLFGAVALPFALVEGDWRRVLAALALWPLAYVAYRAAAVRALGWGRLVRAGLDLYLDDTGTKLGLRALNGEPDMTKKRWTKVSKWLAYGGLPPIEGVSRPVIIHVAEGDWYKEKEAGKSPATLTCSAGVSVTARVVERPYHFQPTATEARLPRPSYDVVILAGYVPSADAPTSPAAGGFVMVSDTRLPDVAVLSASVIWPDGTTMTPQETVLPDPDGPDALLWSLPGLAAAGGATLRYAVEPATGWTWLRAGPDVSLVSIKRDRAAKANQLIIQLTYSGPAGGRAEVWVEPVDGQRAATAFKWLVSGAGWAQTAAIGSHDPAARRTTWAITNATPMTVYWLFVTVSEHGVK